MNKDEIANIHMSDYKHLLRHINICAQVVFQIKNGMLNELVLNIGYPLTLLYIYYCKRANQRDRNSIEMK